MGPKYLQSPNQIIQNWYSITKFWNVLLKVPQPDSLSLPTSAAVQPDEKSEEFLQVRDLNLFFSDVDP